MHSIPDVEKSKRIIVNPDNKWNMGDLDQIPEEYHTAATYVIEELKKDGENPSAFDASLALLADEKHVFHLWHRSAYPLIKKAQEGGNALLGNPGGKCRNITYDPSQKKIIDKWMWE